MSLTLGAIAADKNGVSPQVISLPSGPGSVQGLGESFQMQLNTGGGSYSVPIMLPPGPAGHAPKLALSYNSGSGNGPLGIGWSCAGAPSIERNTDHGVPRYVDSPNGTDDDGDGVVDNVEEIDRIAGMDREELVLLADGFWRSENESSFVRHQRTNDGWQAQTKEGVLYEFGTTPESRIEEGGRVFRWLVDRVTDLHDNVIIYRYMTNSGSLGQKYLREIRWHAASATAFYAVVFSYSDSRPDVFPNYRSGFEITTGLRMTSIDVMCQGVPATGTQLTGDLNGDGTTDNLIRRYRLEYVEDSHVSLLHRVTQIGDDGVSALPPATFGYSNWIPPENVALLTLRSEGDPPGVGLDNGSVELIDFNQDALPDLITTEGGAHHVHANRGINENGALAWDTGGQPVINAPLLDLASERVHLADINADGSADLVHKQTSTDFQFYLNTGQTNWARSDLLVTATTSFPVWPHEGISGHTTRTLDLDHNRHSDILYTSSIGYRMWMLLPNGQYTKEKRITPLKYQGEDFHFDLRGAHIADLNGDRLQDLVWVRPSRVVYWPSKGHGNFGSPVILDLDEPLDSWSIDRSGFADVNGDGLADLTIIRPWERINGIHYWINLGRAGLAPRRTIAGLPSFSSREAVRWADMDGNGAVDILISNGGEDPGWRQQVLCLVAGVRPNLLVSASNGIGRTVEVTYQSSVDQMLEAGRRGRPWRSTMPTSVTVVSQIDQYDGLGNVKTRIFTYRDPYYDPEKQEFRGFSQADSVEIGDESAPSLAIRTDFDTGKEFEAMKGKPLRVVTAEAHDSEFSDDSSLWFSNITTDWRTKVLHQGSNEEQVVYAHPISSETSVIEQGRGSPLTLRSEFEYDNYGNKTVDRQLGIITDDDRGPVDDERTTTTGFIYDLDKWILSYPKMTEVADEHGSVISRSEFYYDDETFAGVNLGVISNGNATLTRDWIDPEDPDAFVNTSRAKFDSHGNAIVLLDPLAQAPLGEINSSVGHYAVVDYDEHFHTYPIGENIHLEKGKDPLTIQVEYHLGFGKLLTSSDFNGHATFYNYDSFGRLISVIRPGDSEAFPTQEFSYALGQTFGPGNVINHIETRALDKQPGTAGAKKDHYLIARNFVDGLGRIVMTKEEAAKTAEGNPQVILKGVTIFNNRQQPVETLNPCFTSLAGNNLDALLEFEDIHASGWKGLFHDEGEMRELDLELAPKAKVAYDATLRSIKATNQDGSHSTVIYQPLATKTFDENDSDPTSPFFNTPKIHHNDGLNRLIRIDEVTRLNDDGTKSGDLRTWTTQFKFDLNDQLIQTTDAQGNVKTLTYDGLKRRVFMNDPDRGITHDVYDAASNLIETTDAKEQRITFTYDGVNRILTEDYHDEGHPLSAERRFDPTQPIGESNLPDVAYSYDLPLANLDQGDNTVETARNTRGMLAYVRDLSGEQHFSYDARGRVQYEIKRVPDPLFWTNRSMSISPVWLVSYKTVYEYDSLDRVTRLIYPDLDELSYEYNDRGLLARIPGGPNGSILSGLQYLPSGQHTQVEYGNGVKTTYDYDRRLRLTELKTRHDFGMASEGGGLGTELIHFIYEFDSVSNIRAIHDQRSHESVPAGDKRRNTQFFAYDDLYRLTGVQYSFNLPGQPRRDDGSIHYRYDRIGNMLSKTSDIDHIENGLSVTDLGDMSYGGSKGSSSRLGRQANDSPGPHALSSIRHSTGGTRQYEYDANGNMRNIDGLNCTWDFKDRLVAVENNQMRAEYTYDYIDRRITKRVVRKDVGSMVTADIDSNSTTNEIPASFTTIYPSQHFEVREHDEPAKFIFDGAKRIARLTGDLTTDVRVQRVRLWEGWNLVAVAVRATNALDQIMGSSAGEVQADEILKLDTDSQRFLALESGENLEAGAILWIRSRNNCAFRLTGQYPGAIPPERAPPDGRSFSSAGLQVAKLEHLIAINSTVWQFDAENQLWKTRLGAAPQTTSDGLESISPGQAIFIHSDAQDDLGVDESNLSIRYYHQDHLGSSSTITDSQGKLIEQQTFYPYGSVRTEIRPCRGAPSSAYKFTGMERDIESGLQYHNARFYIPTLCRWPNCDPAGEAGGLNLYQYSHSNPLQFTDVNGMEPSADEVVGVSDLMQRRSFRRIHNVTELFQAYGGGHSKTRRRSAKLIRECSGKLIH